jgi:hypothetical protein
LSEGFQQDFSFFYARAELVKDKKPLHGIKVLFSENKTIVVATLPYTSTL